MINLARAKTRFNKINLGKFLRVFFGSHKAEERVRECSVIVSRGYSLTPSSEVIQLLNLEKCFF
jgi:hypothetical protein